MLPALRTIKTAVTLAIIPFGLIACGPDPNKSTSNLTDEITPRLSIAADFERDEINVSAEVLTGGDFPIRLVYGDYLSIETGSTSYALYRGERELAYRNRSAIKLTDTEYPAFKLAFYRINETYVDAVNSVIRLPDLKSFSIDEANVLTSSDGSLTGRWADSVNGNIEMNLSIEATVDACTTTTGTVISAIADPGLVLAIDPGVRIVTVPASELSNINTSGTDSLSFCDFSVQLVSQEISVNADPALAGLIVTAVTRSPVIQISVTQSGGGA